MQDFDKILDHYLYEWAQWSTRHTLAGIGWSRTSVITKIGEGKGNQLTSMLPEIHEVAEQIELFVVRLAKVKQELARALRSYYCEPGTVRRKAEQMGISHTVF